MRLQAGSLSAVGCLVPVRCALQWCGCSWHLPASKEKLLDAAIVKCENTAAVKHSGRI